MRFIGKVGKNGILADDIRQMIAGYIRCFPDKLLVVTVTVFVRRRSDNQNRFFHGPFLEVALGRFHEAGNVELTNAELKELFKEQYGVRKLLRMPDGSELEVLKSTSDYSTVEMEDFMEKLRAHYAPFFPLPYPNEVPL